MSKVASQSLAEIPKKSTREFKDVIIVRDGEQITIPEGMSYNEARTWLTRQEEAEEKVVSFQDRIPCYPLDGIVSVMMALQERYGFAELRDQPGFWGPVPPTMFQVPLADGRLASAPIGRIAVPRWQEGYMDLGFGRDAILVISGQIKKKIEPEIKQIIALARQFIQHRSIYRGNAVYIDLSWMSDGERFDPVKHSPKFMNQEISGMNEEKLILNEVTAFKLKANIFTLIEQTAACVKNRIPLKHGCLFMGPFGTGKTLCAKLTASKCIQNGWTFMYLKNAAHLADALRLAQLYAPAVVFTEDIDQCISGDRGEYINEVLNTMDGVDTKDNPIITILTTNDAVRIEPAFMRAGRIDTVVHFTAPDAQTAKRFIDLYARDEHGEPLLAPDQDLTDAGKAMEGFVPAFIAESVQKAKRYAIFREGSEIKGKLLAKDIELAGLALREHAEMVNRDKTPSEAELVAAAVGKINSHRNGDDPIAEKIDKLEAYVRDNLG